MAFENPRKIKIRSESSEDVKKKRKNSQNTSLVSEGGQLNGKFDPYLVPDRVTGLEELAELQTVCPHRRWNFVSSLVTAVVQVSSDHLYQD